MSSGAWQLSTAVHRIGDGLEFMAGGGAEYEEDWEKRMTSGE